MNRFARIAVIIPVLSFGFGLTGCGSLDPTDLMDVFNTKKPLPGDRRAVFPEGTPGVPQGVPAELVRGYQPPPEPEPQVAAPAEEPKPKPKAKPKPKPKVAAKPPEESNPTPVTVRPSGSQPASATQWPDPPKAQQQPSQNRAQQPGQVVWPDPPPAGSFSR